MSLAEQPNKVFVCWSGERGRCIANKLADWLPKVIPELENKLFVSEQLEKGIEWFPEIAKELEKAGAGILCLTPENLQSAWLLFEAGALAKQLTARSSNVLSGDAPAGGARICTYLHGIKPADLTGPLTSYQWTTTTREDTLRLAQSLARIASVEQSQSMDVLQEFEKRWPELETFLRDLKISVPEVFPAFESLFQRKTFNEPLKKCVDQNWLGRHDGVRQTREALRMQLPLVRDACPQHQVDLYEMLVEQVDSYGMAIDGLLLGAKSLPFDLADTGELKIPSGIHAACETRRLMIKQTVSWVLDPLMRPFTNDAVRFKEAEEFAQKKTYVHRAQHRIMAHRAALKSEGRQERGSDAIKTLLAGTQPEDYRKSAWDLDRIYSYLVDEFLAERKAVEIREPLEAVRMELETAGAQQEPRSLMPLHYALGALESLIPDDIEEEDRAAVEKQLVNVEQYLERSRLDSGGQIRRTLREIRDKLRAANRLSNPVRAVDVGQGDKDRGAV